MPSWNVGIEPLGSCIHGQVTTSGTATILFATSTQPSVSSIVVKAFSGNTNDIYVGMSNVTTATGFVLHPRDSIAMDLDFARAPVYIISPGTAQKVAYLAVY